jgi:DNA-binding NtrC family response regulator
MIWMTPTINQSLNIFIVDHEVNLRKALSACLETEDQKVIAVCNFQGALAQASRRSFGTESSFKVGRKEEGG